MLDKLEEMICFAAICDAGSITNAAQELNKSKAYVSRKLSDLEVRIGTKLMYRSTRSLKITDAGRRLQTDALHLYRSSQRLNHRAKGLDDRIRGNFVITATYSMAEFMIAPMMPELQNAFPEVNFEIRATNKWLDLLSDGVDLAIRSGAVVDDRLIAHQIGSATDKFFTSPDFLAQIGDVRDLDDLLQHRIIVNRYSMDNDTINIFSDNDAVKLSPRHMLTVSEQPLLVDMVQQNLGIGLAFDHTIRRLEARGEAISILPDWAGRTWPLFVVYPFVAPVPAKLAQISAFLRKHLSAALAYQ